jgi:hypothetical protein
MLVAVSSLRVAYRRTDNFRPVSFSVSAWEWVYATNLSRLPEGGGGISKRDVGEAHSILTTATLLSQRLSCYWGKIMALLMLTNLMIAGLRLTTAQRRSAGQNLPSDLYLYSFDAFHCEALPSATSLPRWIWFPCMKDSWNMSFCLVPLQFYAFWRVALLLATVSPLRSPNRLRRSHYGSI